MGEQSNKALEEILMSEDQNYNEQKDEVIEIIFTDVDTSSQILKYGFYLAAAFEKG